jgi:Fe-S oxidoreductase
MTSPSNIAWLLIITAVIAAAGAWRRWQMWRAGQPASVDWIGGLMAIPRRYLVDVHDVVAREPVTARMHVHVAGGLVAILLLLILIYFLDVQSWWLRLALLIAVLMMWRGLRMLVERRREPPAHLSRGGFQRLPDTLRLLAVGLGVLAVFLILGNWEIGGIVGFALFVTLVLGMAELAVATWGGPLKHAFAGALHLAFHPRPERFSGEKRSTALKPLDLSAPRLGVERPIDFKWNQLLGFDACVQCGRCEQMCPAFAAGQPLNPKKLIQDMVLGFSATGDDRRYSGSPHPGQQPGERRGAPTAAIVPDLLAAETLWACTTCRACVYECPMMIEHVDAIVDMRRHSTLTHGATPAKAVDVLEELRQTDNSGGQDPKARIDWAVDQRLRLMRDVRQTDVLLWLGDGAFDRRVQRTLRALFKLLRAAGVDFAVLGEEELDCGDLARRLGDEATFQSLARRNIAILERYRFNLIVTADPHAYHSLKNEYPALGGRYRVMHHTGYLAELQQQGRLKTAARTDARPVAYHDPCYLGRYNGEIEAPRALLRSLGMPLNEMARSGLRSRCCGGGGGAAITDVPGKQRIPDMRMDDARAAGAEIVAVACPQCTVMLEGVVGPRPEVKDVAELLAEAVVE